MAVDTEPDRFQELPGSQDNPNHATLSPPEAMSATAGYQFSMTSSPSPAQQKSLLSHNRTFTLLGAALLQFPIWCFPMTFGIFQQSFSTTPSIFPDSSSSSSSSSTGLIGTTLNGVLYLSMPFLFTFLDSPPHSPPSPWRKRTAYIGVVLSSLGFVASSFATQIWHLIFLQGVLVAVGSAMVYAPTTLLLDAWFSGDKRATAYGAILSSKNIVGTVGPFIMLGLLEKVGLRWTLRIWAVLSLLTGIIGVSLMPEKLSPSPSPSSSSSCHPPQRHHRRHRRRVPWSFLSHPTFYIYSLANILQSASYALPQTYLSQYASTQTHLPPNLSTLILTLFNAPGIISGLTFGFLADRQYFSASTNTLISALGSAVCIFLLWGTASKHVFAVLILFCTTYGFFAGGYSSTWGGWIKDLEAEAAERNEAIYTGMLYGLFNGARGLGYVVAGPIGVRLLDVGAVMEKGRGWGYGTQYGAMMVFAGVGSALGGWSSVWRVCQKAKGRVRR